MKIRSLLLGSVAAAGLSTGGAYAADLGVLTSLDVCDALGLSGLTISSDTNCLQITGEVKYKFIWGDYDNDDMDILVGAGDQEFIGGDGHFDWDSRFDAWIKFVATADSDFGPAKAVLKLKQVDHSATIDVDGAPVPATYVPIVNENASSDTSGVVLDEAYVSIGDSTVIMAGKKGSIMKKGDDEPLNWLGLFNSDEVDLGVSWGPFDDADGVNDSEGLPDGGHVIQVVSDLGNGFSIGAGLEKLDTSNSFGQAGTAVGVISYAGEGISAHITGAAAGVLDGEIEAWGVHAGFAGTFDNFKVVLAGAFGATADDANALPADAEDLEYWNVLASASATFDIFTIAASFEAVDANFYPDDGPDFGAGASITAAVADGVTLNLGGRWYQQNMRDGGADAYQVAAGVTAAVTESITVTGEIGYINDGDVEDQFYGSGKLAWAPGGGYTSSIKGTVTSGTEDTDVGYKIETEFKKTFE